MVRYDDVIVDLRTAYDRGAELRESMVKHASFDALYTANCLLHVPDSDLPAALADLAALLRPGGLMYLGVWGGEDREGPLDDDEHEPTRFFAWRTDEQIQAYVSPYFTILDFHTVTTSHNHHFQSLTLRTRTTGG